jgi:DTW domain-containing protein YfiP
MNELKISHHSTLLDTYKEKTDWWKNEVDGKSRCASCWLRCHDCFCGVILEKASQYSQILKTLQQQCHLKLEVVIYYHNLEIGRSANTAHIFEALCKEVTTSIIYGNTVEEEKFWRTLIEETNDNASRSYTCVLYPDKGSVLLNDWLKTILSLESNSKSSDREVIAESNFLINKLRIILLDGTYPCASRIARYLQTSQKSFLSSPASSSSCAVNMKDSKFQFVLLDLDSEENMVHRKSAVAGVMYQPGKDKICSYQAVAIALKDVLKTLNSSDAADQLIEKLFTSLLVDLHEWIAYIIKKKIKCGKIVEKRKAVPDVDNSPAEYIRNIVVRYFR